MPYPAADRLVEIESQRGTREMGVSYPDYLDWRERSRGFAGVAFLHADLFANLHLEIVMRDGRIPLPASGTTKPRGTEAEPLTLWTGRRRMILAIRGARAGVGAGAPVHRPGLGGLVFLEAIR